MNDPNRADIVLVEDNPCDAELLLRGLKKRNFANHLVWLKDGAAVLEYLFVTGGEGTPRVRYHPSVVLLDLKLPKVDGLEVLRQLKTNPSSRDIPVVVLTSSREEQDVVQSYQLGVNSYIVKPVNFENFSEAAAHLGLYWLLLNQRPAARPNEAS